MAVTARTLVYKSGYLRPADPQLLHPATRTTTTVTYKGPPYKTNLVSR